MNKLSAAKRVAVVSALVEGNSIRATARMANVSKPTILKLLAQLGSACAAYQDVALRQLNCRRIQCDEIWSFCYAKRKAVTPKIAERHPDAGDVWTWTAIDADTKLCVSWFVGGRDAGAAYQFISDLTTRLQHRVQLTTDQHRAYLTAVEDCFAEVDYAMLHKLYTPASVDEGRYSPPTCIGTRVQVLRGDPDPKHISTSYVERQNLTMRMQMRRFTRLTNAFSKKLENHVAAIALHFLHYNFARIHQTLRVTPAMAAGVSDHVWSIEEIVGLLDAADKKAA
jgi:IS1 family transposase